MLKPDSQVILLSPTVFLLYLLSYPFNKRYDITQNDLEKSNKKLVLDPFTDWSGHMGVLQPPNLKQCACFYLCLQPKLTPRYFLFSSDNNCIVNSSSPKGLSKAKEWTTKSIINTRSALRGWKTSVVPRIAQRVRLSFDKHESLYEFIMIGMLFRRLNEKWVSHAEESQKVKA